MNARSNLVVPSLTFALVLLTGCGDGSGGANCLASIEPAFILEIRDSVSTVGVAVQSTATVVDGSFSDTLPLTPFDGNDAWREGPTERGGTYNLTVAAPGYQTWALQDVTVPEYVCGVETVRLQVQLQND